MQKENTTNIRNADAECCICEAALDGHEFDSFMVRHGRIYRFCKEHGIILDLATTTVHQIRSSWLMQMADREDPKRKRKKMEVKR